MFFPILLIKMNVKIRMILQKLFIVNICGDDKSAVKQNGNCHCLLNQTYQNNCTLCTSDVKKAKPLSYAIGSIVAGFSRAAQIS